MYVILIVLLNIVSVSFVSFVYDKTYGEIIRNCIFALFFSLGLAYLLSYSYTFKKLDYDNREHIGRFFVTYLVSFLLSLLFPLVDKKGWIFLAIGIAVSLFSNAFIGMYSVGGLILISVLLTNNADTVTVCIYFLASFLGIMLFQDIDKSFKVSSSILISVLLLTALEIVGFVMLENTELSFEQFIMPLANIAINILVLIFVLKYFNQAVANKYRNKYLEVNDQEYKALIALKEISMEEYYRSIHTAYLTERIAAAIGCDVDASKNCAYYHRVKKAFNMNDEQCEQFVVDNEFPPEASELLLNFLNKSSRLVSKEACIVYISDKVISSFMTIFAKDKNIKLDYEALINTMFDKDYFKSALEDSDLTQKDYRTIKEILLKETLYYDFLR